jgi:hypothetical protein
MRTGWFETTPGGQTNKTQTTMIHSDTRLIDLTVAQLAEVIDKAVQDSIRRHSAEDAPTKKWLVYGIAGIAQLFGVSERQARYIKASGVINKAIKQQGRTIVCDASLALELYGRRHS